MHAHVDGLGVCMYIWAIHMSMHVSRPSTCTCIPLGSSPPHVLSTCFVHACYIHNFAAGLDAASYRTRGQEEGEGGVAEEVVEAVDRFEGTEGLMVRCGECDHTLLLQGSEEHTEVSSFDPHCRPGLFQYAGMEGGGGGKGGG